MPDQPPQIRGIHHGAFRCRDAEETRQFYEDVLGLPLRAALTFDKDPAGNDRPFMHLFFEMGDGSYIAFFDLPHTVDEKHFRVRDGMEEYHVAMEVGSREELEAFQSHLAARDVPVFGPIDHDFCHSIYFYDPNGIALELTCRDPRHDEIMAEESRNGARVMKDWTDATALVRAERMIGTEEERARKRKLVRDMAATAREQLAKAAGG